MVTQLRSSTGRTIATVAALGVLTGLVAGCGGGEDRVALPIVDARWADATHLVLSTSCAEMNDVEIDRSAPVVEVSLWGAPKFGRCRDRMVLKVESGTTKIVDGATSQVIDLPTFVPDPDGGGHHGG